jgi:hypothetical protein
VINLVQDNQQMLKGVVSFIILIKLPHVSAANCHLQGITRSSQATPVLSAPRVDVGYDSLGVASHRGFHETRRGNLMSTIKLTRPLRICWFSCTGKSVSLMKNRDRQYTPTY